MKSRVELLALLNQYKNILTSEVMDYLEGIINLEYSVVRDDIICKNHLDELDIYRKAAIYNIYYRTKELIKKYDDEKLLIFVDYLQFEYGYVKLNSNIKPTMNLFQFEYGQNKSVDDGDFGYINLYRYPNIENELEITNNKIETIIYERNMFDGTSSSNEKYERLARYNSLIKYYNHLRELQRSDTRSYKIKYINDCVDMLSKDYDLISPKCLVIKKSGITINQRIGNL